MINPQLLDYVQQQLAAGISKEEISKALVTNGWQVTDINDVFAIASSMPTTQLPVQASSLNFMQSAAVSGGTSHVGMWAIVIILLLLVGTGGAFAAYQAGLFTTSPTALVTNNEASTTPVLPVAGTIETASSTVASTTAVITTAASATTSPLAADVVSNNPSAKFTINNTTSVVGRALTFTLRWSSTNADKFSKMESISGCSNPNFDLQNMAINVTPTPTSGTEPLAFTANDLSILAGCDMKLTFIAENTKTGKKAQSFVDILFPKTTVVTVSPFISAGNDATIKSDLSVIQTEADILYNSGNVHSYGTAGTSCTNSNSIFTNTTIINALAGIKAVQNMNGSVGNTITCNNSMSTYAVSSGMFSSRKIGSIDYWCIDSTGGSSESTIPLGLATVCPVSN